MNTTTIMHQINTAYDIQTIINDLDAATVYDYINEVLAEVYDYQLIRADHNSTCIDMYGQAVDIETVKNAIIALLSA